MQYVPRYPFVLKYQDFGPPETSSGTALFCYLYDKNYAFEYAILCYAAWHRVRPVGPGTHRLKLYLKFHLQPDK